MLLLISAIGLSVELSGVVTLWQVIPFLTCYSPCSRSTPDMLVAMCSHTLSLAFCFVIFPGTFCSRFNQSSMSAFLTVCKSQVCLGSSSLFLKKVSRLLAQQ